MRLTDDELKALYRERTEPATRDACPSAEELAGAPSDALAAHLASCSACAGEYRLLGELEPVIASAARARPAPAWRWLAVAAAIVLAAGTALVVWRTSEGPPPRPVDRSGQTAPLRTEPPNGASLVSAPVALSWEPVDAATSYRVTLYDFESTPVWESPSLTTPSVAVPEDVRARLPAGKPLYWRVVATSGVDRRDFGPFQFAVAPGSER